MVASYFDAPSTPPWQTCKSEFAFAQHYPANMHSFWLRTALQFSWRSIFLRCVMTIVKQPEYKVQFVIALLNICVFYPHWICNITVFCERKQSDHTFTTIYFIISNPYIISYLWFWKKHCAHKEMFPFINHFTRNKGTWLFGVDLRKNYIIYIIYFFMWKWMTINTYLSHMCQKIKENDWHAKQIQTLNWTCLMFSLVKYDNRKKCHQLQDNQHIPNKYNYLPFPSEKPFPSPCWTSVRSACHSQRAAWDDTWSQKEESEQGAASTAEAQFYISDLKWVKKKKE